MTGGNGENSRSQIPADRERSDFSCIRRPSGRENSPGNAAEELSNKHDFDRRSEEDNEDEAGQNEQSHHQYPAMTPSGCCPPIQQGADDVGESTKAVELLLPVRRDLEATFFVQISAILESEAWVTEERAEQGHVIALHDNGGRDHCHRVSLKMTRLVLRYTYEWTRKPRACTL